MPYSLQLEPRPPDYPVPFTAFQTAYWRELAKQYARRSSYRNTAASLRLSGTLDIARLERGIQTAVNRHESLRTRMAQLGEGERPIQIVDPPRPIELPVIDLSQTDLSQGEAMAQQFGREFLAENIDLRTGPVFDARLVKLSSREHVLMLVLDHIVSDATSYPILTNEVISSLTDDARQTGEASPLRVQFPDYAVWQQRTKDEWRREHESYWRAKLSNFRRLTIPTDHPSEIQPLRSSNTVLNVPFGKNLTSALQDVARRESCLMPLIVLSLYLVLMSKWCQRTDLLVSSLSHGRHSHPELRNMIGCIAHPVFLRVEVGPKDTLRDILKCVISELHSSLTHDASRVPATGIISDDPTEIVFNWLPGSWGLSGTHASALRQAENGVRIRSFPIGSQLQEGAKFAPFFTDTPSGILLVIWYGGDLFLRETVERFASRLRHLVEMFVMHPDTKVGSLDVQI